MKKHMIAIAVAMTSLVVLSACETTVQTTSGRAYLDQYRAHPEQPPGENPKNQAGPSETIDAKVQRVAAVEPTLRFPARIGLARIEKGRLSGISNEEAKAWMLATKRLGAEFGEFVPLNRLVAEMVDTPSFSQSKNYRFYNGESQLHRTMKKNQAGRRPATSGRGIGI